jgi:hypothetical protein
LIRKSAVQASSDGPGHTLSVRDNETRKGSAAPERFSESQCGRAVRSAPLAWVTTSSRPACEIQLNQHSIGQQPLTASLASQRVCGPVSLHGTTRTAPNSQPLSPVMALQFWQGLPITHIRHRAFWSMALPLTRSTGARSARSSAIWGNFKPYLLLLQALPETGQRHAEPPPRACQSEQGLVLACLFRSDVVFVSVVNAQTLLG